MTPASAARAEVLAVWPEAYDFQMREDMWVVYNGPMNGHDTAKGFGCYPGGAWQDAARRLREKGK